MYPPTPLLPQNTEAERCLLHQIMYEYGLDFGDIIDGELTPECFYDMRNRSIYECLVALYKAGEIIDIIKMYEWLEREKKDAVTPYDVASLVQVQSSESAHYYVQVLLRYYWRRQGILLCQQCANRLYEEIDVPDEVIGTAADMLQQIPMSHKVERSTLNDAARMVISQMEDNLDPARRHRGSSTGFRDIDETGGLPEVGVTVIAADTGQGKSSFAIDLAMHNLQEGEKVGFFSLEMPQEDLARRIIANMTGIAYHRLAYDSLSADEQALVRQATATLYDNGGHRFLFDNRMDNGIEGIIASIRRMADPRRDHVTHFYVDYMQILSWAEEKSKNRGASVEQLLASAARAFHNISVKMKIQIVLLSQVNRDHDNRELTLDRIRDSKQIADAATCVVLLYRPEEYHSFYQTERFRNIDPTGTALVHVAKRRNGPTVQFIAGFDGIRTHFFQLDKLPTIAGSPTFTLGL